MWNVGLLRRLPVVLKVGDVRVEIDVARMTFQLDSPCLVLLHQPLVIATVLALPIQIGFVVLCGTPIGSLHIVVVLINHHPAHAQQVDVLDFSTVEHKGQAERDAESFGARHVMLGDLAQQHLLKDGSSFCIILCLIGDVLDGGLKTLGTSCRFQHVLQHVVEQLGDAFDDFCASVASPSPQKFLNRDDNPRVISSQKLLVAFKLCP